MFDTIEKIANMKKCLTEFLDKELKSDLNCLQDPGVLKAAGEIVDMIKDLAEAERNCEEACYYITVVKAMEGYEDYPAEGYRKGRRGYNPRRMANGEYASKGEGHYGYHETMPIHMMDRMMDNHNWGYTRSGQGNRSQSGSRMGYVEGINDYGRTYDKYRDAKRHYTETHSEDHKREMNEHARDHVNHAMGTLKEVWETADPELRQRMKTDIDHLRTEMN